MSLQVPAVVALPSDPEDATAPSPSPALSSAASPGDQALTPLPMAAPDPATVDGRDGAGSLPSAASADPPREAGEASAASGRSAATRELLASTLRVALALDVVIVGPVVIGGSAPTFTASGMLTMAVGLIVANTLASQLSLWFMGEWAFGRAELARIGAQLVGGALAAAVVVAPLAVAGPGAIAEQVSEPVLEGLMVVVTYLAARRAGRSRSQAVGAVLIVMTTVAILMLLKALAAS